MRVLGWCVALTLIGSLPLLALGTAEDPQERLTKSWTLETVRTLELRGEVRFKLSKGDEPRVTVQTTRALFDQLTVSNWFGSVTVAIESGLRGPREDGLVEVTIELPSLLGLVVLDHSSGTVAWPPGTEVNLRVGENSVVDLEVQGVVLSIDASWLSSVKVTGRTDTLALIGRHQARVDARSLTVGTAQIALDEKSSLEAGRGWKASGTARHGSRVTVPERVGWEAFVLREDAVLSLTPQ